MQQLTVEYVVVPEKRKTHQFSLKEMHVEALLSLSLTQQISSGD
ncbi:hypothetical protein [Aliikangiella maris]|uniref:Uncharacterized protein n=1 Tax=Aliikangiella maris TaxID=3162458 RepID=A0ABV3MVG5_9GAMM